MINPLAGKENGEAKMMPIREIKFKILISKI